MVQERLHHGCVSLKYRMGFHSSLGQVSSLFGGRCERWMDVFFLCKPSILYRPCFVSLVSIFPWSLLDLHRSHPFPPPPRPLPHRIHPLRMRDRDLSLQGIDDSPLGIEWSGEIPLVWCCPCFPLPSNVGWISPTGGCAMDRVGSQERMGETANLDMERVWTPPLLSRSVHALRKNKSMSEGKMKLMVRNQTMRRPTAIHTMPWRRRTKTWGNTHTHTFRKSSVSKQQSIRSDDATWNDQRTKTKRTGSIVPMREG